MVEEAIKQKLKESKEVLYSDIENVQISDRGIIAKNGMCKCDYCNEEMPAKLYAQCPNCKRHASIY